MEKYLDTQKSVIISSPAGSGKTEKLARRYISLLKEGSEPEKILCITFTEKAASEMKERILKILSREEPEILKRIKPKIPLMRISTIHAFCLKLLKRFSIEIGLDPSMDVMDELASGSLWLESIFEAIEAEKESPSIFFETMKKFGLRGGDSLMDILDMVHKKRSQVELIISENQEVEGEDAGRIIELYIECLKRYNNKKKEHHLMDFDDLELWTYKTLSNDPEWQNILYAFDEHTDHLLVDEFQDTSTLQWKIIDKLTEEWRAGLGAKRDAGKTPTIFLVGDEKQSIYRFRGANVSIFENAKKEFSEWLRGEYHFEEVKENYRSLPEIVDFVNRLFEKIMPRELLDSWKTRYSPFEAVRKGKGKVELILHESAGKVKEDRLKESALLANTIGSLYGTHQVYDEDHLRPCKYSDMVILLRKRTYLGLFESALRKEGIPFIVLKGIGFYKEPEIAILREFVCFLIDPEDDYSLFNLLRSPIFGLKYKEISGLIKHDRPLIESLKEIKKYAKIYSMLLNVLESKAHKPLSIIIEEMLATTNGWSHFTEPQRHSNIKKFINIIGYYEENGLSYIEIREQLIRHKSANEVAKANINAEAMNAVKIMTIHASKGLQFPMVFIPSIDESNSSRSSAIVVDDEPDKMVFAYEPDSRARSRITVFERLKQKELEEDKRLFYVALTRARDYLCMIGAASEKPKGRLLYIDEAFGLKDIESAEMPFNVITEKAIEERRKKTEGIAFADAVRFMDEFIYTDPIPYQTEFVSRSVTEELDVRARHGEEWVVVGRVMHRLIEELSKGVLVAEKIQERAKVVLREESLDEVSGKEILKTVLKDFEGLRESGYLEDIILPCENSYSELPFNLRKGKTLFKGRIDRLIIRNGVAEIYDYKSFPVKKGELNLLKEKYRFQMEIYKEAVAGIFNLKTEAYLLFTHVPRLERM